MQLTKEIHEKIILQYLGTECIIESNDFVNLKILISSDIFYWYSYIEVKPLLTPLDKISEEHLIILDIDSNKAFKDLFQYRLISIADWQQLQAWHYAMPDYVYLDGKTPIEAGIAYDKTTYNK